MVLPTFVAQALSGEDITVYGSGLQSRCFTHVFDIVSGLAALAGCDRTIGEIYNLGSTTEVSINQLAQLVLEATASSSQIVHIPFDQAYEPGFEDMQRRLPDISKAQAAFGFAPRHELTQIVADVVASIRTQAQPQSRSIAAPLT
jgi:UDP-glucose 4-epimerase